MCVYKRMSTQGSVEERSPELQTVVNQAAWVLGTKLRFSGRAASALNLRAVCFFSRTKHQKRISKHVEELTPKTRR